MSNYPNFNLPIMKPGSIARSSGIYQNTHTGNEVITKRGDRLPPTQNRGQGYRLIHKAIHAKPAKKTKVLPGQAALLSGIIDEDRQVGENLFGGD